MLKARRPVRLRVEVSYINLDQMSIQINQIIDGLHERWPAEIRERLDQRIPAIQPKPEAITTEEDQKCIKGHIDELFKKKGGGDERLLRLESSGGLICNAPPWSSAGVEIRVRWGQECPATQAGNWEVRASVKLTPPTSFP